MPSRFPSLVAAGGRTYAPEEEQEYFDISVWAGIRKSHALCWGSSRCILKQEEPHRGSAPDRAAGPCAGRRRTLRSGRAREFIFTSRGTRLTPAREPR